MSNFDSIWTERQREDAAAEGWELSLVVDEGKPVQAAYLDIFDKGPTFKNRRAAWTFVVTRAREGSRLHMTALSASSASRIDAAARTSAQRRTR